MVFSSLVFLLIFLPLLVVIYFVIPKNNKHIKQYVLLVFSLLFYASGEPLYIFLIVGCIIVTYLLSILIEKQNKSALVVAIIVNVVPLLVTKYSNFIISNICLLFHIDGLVVPSIVMPIGISFYTFQIITYVVDLYEGKITRQHNVALFALYIMFFPQLIAGPIVKYSIIAEQLENPDISWDNVKYGTGRFIIGLGKKVLIANQAGFIASSIFDNNLSSLTTGMVWLCILAYTIQILFDFSGYSEMAIGLGSIFGFHFPENFADPYTSRSIQDFWRRWHITLGSFFREYVYIPLGGNRVNKARWILNILIVWTLTGLWHGASWNFIIWGLYYGVLIIIERITGIDKKIPAPISWLFTMFFVMIGWAIFLCDGMSFVEIFTFLGKLFFVNGEIINPVSIGSLKLWGYLPFVIIGLFISSPLWASFLRPKIIEFNNNKQYKAVSIVNDVLLVGVFGISFIFLIGGTYNPFIYFQF